MLRRRKNLDVLSRLPLCAMLSAEEIGGLADIAVVHDYPAGQDLTREGEIGRTFFVMLDGQAEVLIGEERVATRSAGDFFGEIALIAHSPRTATVRTTTPVRTVEIRDRAFRALLGREPQLQHKIIRSIGDRILPLPATERAEPGLSGPAATS
jgi:CRP-like cAMP-binding protein